MRTLVSQVEVLPLKGNFTIARGTRTEITVVVARITEGNLTGRGECFPHSRYGETTESVVAQIESVAVAIANGMTRETLLEALPHGAARNAVDCALWDLESRTARIDHPEIRAWTLAGLDTFSPIHSVMTLSLDTPEAMARAAMLALEHGHDRIKVKLGNDDGVDDQRIAAVRAAAPNVSLVVDANEGWRPDDLPRYVAAMEQANVLMIEQPLPAGDDKALRTIETSIPFGADESFHTRADLDRVVDTYQIVNIKLDKAGGLTEGLAAAQAARARGLEVMVGCMLGTSLAMAPAAIVAQHARHVDLDGPLWIAEDRPHGLQIEKGVIRTIDAGLWG